LATLGRSALSAAKATLSAWSAKTTATARSALRHQFGDLLNLFGRHLELFLDAGVHQESRALKSATHHWTAAHHAGTLRRTELPALGTGALAEG